MDHVDTAGLAIFNQAITFNAQPRKQLINAMMGNVLESHGHMVYPFLGSYRRA